MCLCVCVCVCIYIYVYIHCATLVSLDPRRWPSCNTVLAPCAPVLGRSGPNLKSETVCVCGVNGLRNGMNTTKHPPPPASRAETDLSTNVQAVSRAASYVNTHRPGLYVRARPS